MGADNSKELVAAGQENISPDMAAAIEAGITAVGVATGSFSRDQLTVAGAEVVLDSLEDFPAWYRSAG